MGAFCERRRENGEKGASFSRWRERAAAVAEKEANFPAPLPTKNEKSPSPFFLRGPDFPPTTTLSTATAAQRDFWLSSCCPELLLGPEISRGAKCGFYRTRSTTTRDTGETGRNSAHPLLLPNYEPSTSESTHSLHATRHNTVETAKSLLISHGSHRKQKRQREIKEKLNKTSSDMRSPSSIPAALVLLLLLVVCRPPSASAAVLLVPPLGGTPHPLDQPHLGLTNREKWAHYFSRNPLTRLYR